MTVPTIVSGELVFIEIFDTAVTYDGVAVGGAETNSAVKDNWLSPCGLKTTSVTRGKTTREDTSFPCDPADGTLAETQTSVTGFSPMSITAGGDLASDQEAHWEAAFNTSDPHYFRVWKGALGYFEGAFHVTSNGFSGQREGGHATRDLTLVEARKSKWVPAT